MALLQMRDGAQIYYDIEGYGPSIIMLHGWKASSDVYSKAVNCLKHRFRCIRYDQRGHKRSSVPDRIPTMEDLADDLHEIIIRLTPGEKPFLIGWSMGGAAIFEYIKKYGCESIARIIIVDISPRILNDKDWKLGKNDGNYMEKDLASDIALMRSDFRSYLRGFYTATMPAFASMTSDEQESLISERMDGHDPSVLTSLWDSLCHADNRAILPKITVPTAIFYPTILPRCKPQTAKYYATHISGEVHCEEFQNASHALVAEYPQLFAEKVQNFLLQ